MRMVSANEKIISFSVLFLPYYLTVNFIICHVPTVDGWIVY